MSMWCVTVFTAGCLPPDRIVLDFNSRRMLKAVESHLRDSYTPALSPVTVPIPLYALILFE